MISLQSSYKHLTSILPYDQSFYNNLRIILRPYDDHLMIILRSSNNHLSITLQSSYDHLMMIVPNQQGRVGITLRVTFGC
jgi:hypothetical protein